MKSVSKVGRMALMALLACAALLSNAPAASAQSVVKGTVVEANGTPVIGASVIQTGTKNGAITNLDGVFELKVPAGATVEVSCIGYATQTVTATNGMTVVLKEDTTFLDEVVVVAYGTQRRKDLTGSLSEVKSDLVAIQNTTTVSRALEGAAPGIQVSSVDGQPGYDMAIRLRGTSSTQGGSAAALIVIDGVPQQTNGTYENPLAQLNPDDIAQISILKDAASTALYGSRAANGVVLITTKSGQEGKTKISFQGRWGKNCIGNYNTNSIDTAAEYYEYQWLSIYNSYRYGVDGTGVPGVAADGTYYTNVKNPNCSDQEAREFASAHLFDYAGSNTDFQRNFMGNNLAYRVPGAIYTATGSGTNASATMSGAYLVDPTTGKINPDAELLYNGTNGAEAVLQDAFRQEYNVSATGGTEKIHYFTSFGYQDDPSYLLGTGYERYSGRINLDAQITSWMKVGANVGYSKTKTKAQAGKWGARQIGGATGNAMLWIKGWQPICSLYNLDANGDYALDENGDKVLNIKNKSYSPLGEVASAFGRDYSYNAKTDMDNQDINTWTTRVFADINFLKHFNFHATFNMDQQDHTRTVYVNSKYGRTSYGFSGVKNTSRVLLNTQQLLSYNQDFGKHHVDAMVGHEYEDLSKSYLNYGSGKELIAGNTKVGNFISRFSCVDGGENGVSPYRGYDLYRTESYLSRVNYNFAGKYYLSGSFRMDGSSKFTPENRWGKFWSVGGSWRASEEEFMASTKDWLDNLKVRASYGVTGNSNYVSSLYPYAYWTYSAATWAQATNGTGTPETTSITHKTIVDLGIDTSLTWENVHQADAGVDFSMFKSRLTGAIDVYNNKTVNSYFNQTVSPLASVGKTSMTKNAAQVRNRGFEIELSADLIRTKDMTLNVAVNGTHYRTTLVDVPDDQIPNWDETMDLPEGCWSVSTEDMAQAGTAGHAGRGIMYLRGEGKDLFNLYMPKYAGVDEYGLPTYWHRVTYYDVNQKSDGTYDHGGRYTAYKQGDNVVTNVAADASNYEVGSATPDWIGGIQVNFRYKNFDIALNGAYQFGGKFFSMEYSQWLFRSSTFDLTGIPVSKTVVGNTWTESNTDSRFPIQWFTTSASSKMYLDGSMLPGTHNYTDMSLFSGTYFRLKNITVGYTVPKNITQKVKISGLRFFASADNVLLFSAQAGIDPSMSVIGGKEVDTYVYPQMQTYTFGVNLDF